VRRLFYFAPLSLMVTAVVVIGYANHDTSTIEAPPTHVVVGPVTLEGEPFPDITAPRESGASGVLEALGDDMFGGWTTADFARDFPGGAVVVNIWGSWCAPCRAEHPLLTQLAAEGTPIYGLAWKDTPAGSAAFLTEFGNPFAYVGLDTTGEVGALLGVTGAPETFVIGADGVVRVHRKGPIDASFIQRHIRPALAPDLTEASELEAGR